MRNPLPVGLPRHLAVGASAILAALLIASPSAAQQPPSTGSVTDSAAVVEVIELYHEALAAGDSATAISLLAPGALILESGGMETREEYESHHLPADIRFARAVARERGPIHVRVQGDVAWAASVSRSVGTYGQREIDARGAELMVLRRASDRWRIEAIHWSSR